MTTHRFNVAIIGCGLIGAQWDVMEPLSEFSLTHAAGFFKNPRARLVAMCDNDMDKARHAAECWGAKAAYDDPRTMFSEQKIDVAVVATSSAVRRQVIEPGLEAGVKVFVIEKPFATNLEDGRALAATIDAAGARSIINFSRHWDPSMAALREKVRTGGMGPLQRLVGIYGKGVTNNGSHMVDLCAFLCDASPVRARSLGSPLGATEAHWSNGLDRAWDAQVEFQRQDGSRIQLTMLATDQRAFTCFELRIIGSKLICDVRRGGRAISYTEIIADPNYSGYQIPGESASQPACSLEAMDWMVDEAIRLAAGEISTSSCDAHNALLTACTVDAINRSAQRDGLWLEVSLQSTGTSRGKYE
jgi:predicted dehydrogenase